MASLRLRIGFAILEAGIAALTALIEVTYRALAWLDAQHDALCLKAFEDLAREFREPHGAAEPPPPPPTTKPLPEESVPIVGPDSNPILPREVEAELTEKERALVEYLEMWRKRTVDFKGQA